VFWEHGYASTSLTDLMHATGLSKSSLYDTYGSKRGLFDRAFTNYLDEIITPLFEPMEAPGAGKKELIDYFSVYPPIFRSPSRTVATRGCLIINTAVELNDLDHTAAGQVNEYRIRLQAAFRNATQSFSPDNRTADLRTDILTATKIGMLITARVDPESAATLAENTISIIDTW
jgi:TetR/AcrR family transcriptional repressor of nem operon